MVLTTLFGPNVSRTFNNLFMHTGTVGKLLLVFRNVNIFLQFHFQISWLTNLPLSEHSFALLDLSIPRSQQSLSLFSIVKVICY